MTTEEIRAALLATVGDLVRFQQSFANRTFRRAESELAEAEATAADCLHKIRTACADLDRPDMADELAAAWLAGFIKRWGAYQAAGARTANWMVTGPARFPVERNAKRMAIEAKRRWELLQWIDQAGTNAERRAKQRTAAELGPAGVAARELAEARERLKERQDWQEAMKQANRAIRGLHPHYQLANNSAEIRRLTGRVHDLQTRLDRMQAAAEAPAPVAKVIAGVQVVENLEVNRLQLIFPGKPDSETITRLKRTGWRWSSSFGAWQRQLTNAARHAVGYVLQVAA